MERLVTAFSEAQNQSRDKLHVEYPRTVCTLEGFLVGVI